MIDDSVTPVVQKQRRIPVNLSDRAESKIQDLLDQDTIERVPDNQPRSWVSPLVIAPKPDSNDIRFCIDMRMANKAIQRPYTQIPTIADIVNKFQGAERFTKLDLKEAYHQFVLDEQSRNTTTFYGPDGLYLSTATKGSIRNQICPGYPPVGDAQDAVRYPKPGEHSA
ncbi:Hypothetical predicted protein [Paramuricea clavata]|uniref:Uncharacterized protein n=2 Tax=Paramuricea clavata TaxID=317549 RepID=A0A7D9J3B1_PARCT|nr:Hypothetical predicted protein [Paramuricea clavata]